MAVTTSYAALPAAERKMLKELGKGSRMVRDGRGFRAGSRRCGADAAERLLRHDLIEAAGDAYRISGPGMAVLQRASFPDAPNRLPARAGDDRRTLEAARQGARVVNRAEEPLAWLKARDKISDRQFAAGERLRDDFAAAGQMPRLTMAWDAAPVSRGKRAAPDGLLPGERITAAKKRVDGSLAAAGPGLADVLRRTVCLGEGMETCEKALGWPARSGRVVLTLALDRVASYYRLD